MQTTPYPLSLYNTESRKIEELKPLQKGFVKIYTCGPTVYDFAHIGNFRTYVFEDLLRRTLKFLGYQVNQVMNLTDVDDKTIRGATKLGCSLDAYTKPFIEAFFQDLDALGIERAEHYPSATNYIPQMISFIEDLLKNKSAYKGKDGSIYFEISKFKRYGCLSHLHLDELQVGASERIASDEYDKEHVADFVLWKEYDPTRDGAIFWDSPFGPGRPGWHLECSTMAMQILGETIDIHVGGIDNMFPHHENEIAQSEAKSNKRFVNLWMHSEHLLVDGRKMSKSAGNFFTLRDLLKKNYLGTEVRYMLLQTHYKTQLNFTLAGLDAARNSLQRINNFIDRLQKYSDTAMSSPDQATALIQTSKDKFRRALAHDLNISEALSVVFDFIRDANSLLDQKKVSKEIVDLFLQLMRDWNQILNVMTFESVLFIPPHVEKAFADRQMARKDKNWSRADELRLFIEKEGFIIEDSPKGSCLKKGFVEH